MTTREKDESREHRITMEVVVDAYDAEEQAMGWYYYLDDKLTFPFKARCMQERVTSPLRVGEEVIVASLAPEGDCLCEMFVLTTWQGRSLALPLTQLKAVDADEGTLEAIGDWQYWVERGYGFG
ncbi:calcium-binding protein [Thiorhodococcus mannitoliphagus]|uniref:Calcium-binding protein n=1 Tax=Thiorhodococcus mannitoliphagus TaxID=329406 RepID=A0A6P1DUE7_9GAMM|nr:calcium-binding protein [Thiorhodococcus mannitoliphagus]NEX21718.1 calcium-binding protein [Thiorhodococcus mannitoliphagus]